MIAEIPNQRRGIASSRPTAALPIDIPKLLEI
jgi:hypothetical protein